MKKFICSVSFFGILLFSTVSLTAKSITTDDLGATNKVVATFEIESMRMSDDGMLCWTSTKENGSLPYHIEQYVFNKWVEVAHIDGAGTPEANSYSVELTMNSGENKFRLKQIGYDKKSRFSKLFTFFSDKQAVSYKVIKHNKVIEFSDNTYFIVYNPYGKVIKQGSGNSINVSKYLEGNYCIVFDNKVGEFNKKETAVEKVLAPKHKKLKSIRNPYSRYKIN